jgi:chromosome segregation ATPase
MVTLRFVTINLVTVVGKGGRPRKWRSDTDRVRAYRARQRGGEEPPTVDEVLDAGDDAAVAWNRVRELECALEELRRETKVSTASAREAHKALDHERVRFGWINEENTRLRSEIEALRAERDALQEERTTLRETANGLSTPAVRTNPPNREQRRQAERRRRRST